MFLWLFHLDGRLLEFQALTERKNIYTGSFQPLMTSLSKFRKQAAFNIGLIFSGVHIFLWSFSRCIMVMASSIGFISCPFSILLNGTTVKPGI